MCLHSQSLKAPNLDESMECQVNDVGLLSLMAHYDVEIFDVSMDDHHLIFHHRTRCHMDENYDGFGCDVLQIKVRFVIFLQFTFKSTFVVQLYRLSLRRPPLRRPQARKLLYRTSFPLLILAAPIFVTLPHQQRHLCVIQAV